MTSSFEDEDELLDAMWDEELAGTPKWVGRRLSDIREDLAQEEDGSTFLHLVSARIDGDAKFALVGFHADIPGGEWEILGIFDTEGELTAEILKNWQVKVCDS
jgi:hypothetical protein